jgi:hypothetical protein
MFCVVSVTENGGFSNKRLKSPLADAFPELPGGIPLVLPEHAVEAVLALEGRCSGPPKGWVRQHGQHLPVTVDGVPGGYPDESVSAKQSRAAWERLLARIYEVDVLK